MALVKSIDVALRATTTEFESGMSRSSSAMNSFEANAKRVEATMGKAVLAFNTGGISAEEYSKTIQGCQKELDAMAAGFSSMSAATSRAQGILLGMETETERYNRRLAELNKLKEIGALKEHEHARAVAHTTAEYQKGLPVIQQTQTRMQKLTASLLPYIAAGGTAAIVQRGLSSASNLAHRGIDRLAQSFERIDTAHKAAQSIGIATGELMKLRFAIGEIAGVGAEGVDAALKKMNLEIAKASATGKGATDMINAIGLSVQKLAAMTPDRAFLAIAEAISKMDGAGDKAAATVALFGKAGMDLLPVFEDAAAKIKESTEFLSRFGLELTQLDSTAIEHANDTLGRTNVLLDGMFDKIAGRLAPQIDALGTSFLNAAEHGDKLQQVPEWFDNIGSAITRVIDIIDMLSLHLTDALKPFGTDAFDFFTKGATRDVLEYLGVLDKVGPAQKEYEKNLADIQARNTKDAQAKINTPISTGGLDLMGEEREKQAKADAVAKSKALAEAERRAKMIRDMERDVSGNSPDMKFKHTVEDINELLNKQMITLEKRNELVAMAHKTIIEEPAMKKEMEERKKRIDEATKIRVDTSPMEKFAAEAAKIRKLELAGELTQQQAAQATLDARRDAIAALLKLQKAQIEIPRLSIEAPKMPDLRLPAPVIPPVGLPEPMKFPNIELPTPTFPMPQMPTVQAPTMPTSKPVGIPEPIDFNTKAIDDVFSRGYDALNELSGQFTRQGIPLADSLREPFMIFERTVERLKFLENLKSITPEQSAQAQALAKSDAVREMQQALTLRSDFKPLPSKPISETGQDRAVSLVQRVQDNMAKSQANQAAVQRAEFAKPFFAQAATEQQQRMQAMFGPMQQFQKAAQAIAAPRTDQMTAEMALRQEALKARGAELAKQFEHPMKTFQRRMAELQQLKGIGVDRTVLAAAAMDARKQFMDDMAKRPEVQASMEQKGPAALEAGSQQAFSAFHESARNVRNDERLEKLMTQVEKNTARMAKSGVVLAKAKW